MTVSVKSGRLGIPTGITLYQSRILIYGFGAIGRQLLQRILSFEPKLITIVQRSSHSELAENPWCSSISVLTHDQFLQSCDGSIDATIVFLCCTLRAENLGMVNKNFLSKFASEIFIVNVARVSSLICV